MIISLVAALATNRVIGVAGGMPWRLPLDLKHFKRLTTGHTVIMGRKTWDEVGKPLPGRRNIVITRDPGREFPGAWAVGSLAEALRLAAGDEEVFVIGGGEIYRQALPIADRLYLTQVDAEVSGDTYFPEWNLAEWRLISEELYPADPAHQFPFAIRVYERLR